MRFLIKPDKQFPPSDLSDSRPPAELGDAEVPFSNNQIITVMIKQKYGQVPKGETFHGTHVQHLQEFIPKPDDLS